MTYDQAIDYLYTRLPMFTRIGPAAYKEGIGNIVALCKRLGNPHTRYPVVHIAGTNGKGSTSHMLAAVFQQCGYKTGLYTSPHLIDFRERVRVNGTMIPHQGVVDFVDVCRTAFDDIEPSFFEMSTALAFKHFADEKVDVAVVETGLGGRLDSTNVVSPVLTVITNIGWDHKDLLGDTLEKIAAEKAGIIKTGVPVVVSQSQAAVKHVFVNRAAHEDSPIVFGDQSYRLVARMVKPDKQYLGYQTESGLIEIETDLLGAYQSHNVAGVLAAVDLLKEAGYNLPFDAVVNAMANVKTLTGLRGRWEVLSTNPLAIADVAHNEDGLRETLQQVEAQRKARVHFVIGFVRDKDIENILKLFPSNAFYYFCKPNLPRGLDTADLHRLAQQAGLRGTVYENVSAAVNAAWSAAGGDDLIYIGGSTFVVAEGIGGE